MGVIYMRIMERKYNGNCYIVYWGYIGIMEKWKLLHYILK